MLGMLARSRGDLAAARQELERSLALALDAAPAGAQALRARIVADLALTLHQAGRADDADFATAAASFTTRHSRCT